MQKLLTVVILFSSIMSLYPADEQAGEQTTIAKQFALIDSIKNFFTFWAEPYTDHANSDLDTRLDIDSSSSESSDEFFCPDADEYLALFKEHFHVDSLPYKNPVTADILFWSTSAFFGTSSVTVHRVVGARPFIDVLREKYKSHSEDYDDIEDLVDDVAKEYVKRLLGAGIAIQRARNESERMRSCEHRQNSLACPASVKVVAENIRRDQPEGASKPEQFYASVKRGLEKCGHEGSYVVSIDHADTRKFLARIREKQMRYQGWLALEEPCGLAVQQPS